MAVVFRTQFIPVAESTNALVKAAIEAGEAEGLAVRAGRQTAGYGRRGHAWESPEGGLYLSLLLRPAVDDAALATLPLVAGLAVREACEQVTGGAGAFAVKWPNDVLQADEEERSGEGDVPDREFRTSRTARWTVHASSGLSEQAGTSPSPDRGLGEKIAGISCERYRSAVCLGIGVDAAELSGAPSPQILQDAVLAAFAARYDAWLAEGFAPFAAEFAASDALRGRAIRIEVAGRITASGIADGIDEAGRLLLRDDTGAVIRVSSGEAHIAL